MERIRRIPQRIRRFFELWVPLGDMFSEIFSKSMEGLSNIEVSELIPDPADPGYPADLPEVGSASAPQTLPSTRAGGQDDVSSNKLPQTTKISG